MRAGSHLKTLKILATLAALGAVSLLQGCSSLGAHCEGPRPDLYAGVRGDFRGIAHPESPKPWRVLGSIVDTPFSFVWDTLVLPCDATALVLEASTGRSKNHDKAPNPQGRGNTAQPLCSEKVANSQPAQFPEP